MKRTKSPNQVMPEMVRKPVKPVKPVAEPIPEIDTAKAVSFAMSIAAEMKRKQREADAVRAEESEIVYRKRNQQYSPKDLEVFRKKLIDTREALAGSTASTRVAASLGTSDDVEPDGGDGTNQSLRVDAINRLEKTHRSINDIDEALRRIDDGSYGVCLTCGSLILKERLLHSPFVKTCTECQQKLERS